MNKQEYMDRLAHQLAYYQGDHSEILNNYSTIMDEMFDEGLTMDDVITKLGKPDDLAEDIAKEFQLTMTDQVQKSTTIPPWSKTLIFVVVLVIVVTSILSLIFGAIGTFIAVSIGMIGFVFGGVFTSSSVWAIPTLSFFFKLVTTITALAATVSALIIAYFAVYWGSHLLKWVFKKSQDVTKGSV